LSAFDAPLSAEALLIPGWMNRRDLKIVVALAHDCDR